MNEQSPPDQSSGGTSRATKVVRGGAWIYGRGIITSAVNLGVMAILARELSPTDFGLVALAQVLLRFLAIVASNGVGDYVIHDNLEGREERAQAAFWMDLAFSCGVAILGMMIVPVIADFFTNPGLVPILLALLAKYPIDSIAGVPDALIKKSLDFRTLAVRDTILEILSGVASITLALFGWGVWSLVLPGLFLAPIRFGVVLFLSRWRPRLPLRIPEWGKVIRYSGNIIGSNLANTIIAEGDTLIIGKSLSMGDLGLYNLAWQSANMISRNVTNVIGRLAMPALATVADNADRLRITYNRMLRYLALVSFPAILGLMIVADLFIMVIYGPQWELAILPMRILLIYALRHTIGSAASVIYNVVGKPQVGMQLGMVMIPFYLAAIFTGVQFGILGVAVGVTVVRTAFGLVAFQIGANLVGERLGELLSELSEPMASAFGMAAILVALRGILNPVEFPDWLQLVILILTGILSYFLLLRFVFSRSFKDVIFLVDAFSLELGRQVRMIVRY